MPRIARVVIPGVPHHVTQRGNNRQDVFFLEGDRRAYLDLLREHCEYFGVDLLGYCLRDNAGTMRDGQCGTVTLFLWALTAEKPTKQG